MNSENSSHIQTDRTEVVDVNTGVLQEFSDEALDVAKSAAYKLVSEDIDINRVASVMIASRQLYALARLALTRRLTAEGHSWADGVEEVIIRSMSSAANAPFRRTDTLRALESSVKAFMSDEIATELEETRVAELQARDRLEEVLNNRFVVINGKPYEPGHTIVVVGASADVAAAVERLANTATIEYKKDSACSHSAQETTHKKTSANDAHSSTANCIEILPVSAACTTDRTRLYTSQPHVAENTASNVNPSDADKPDSTTSPYLSVQSTSCVSQPQHSRQVEVSTITSNSQGVDKVFKGVRCAVLEAGWSHVDVLTTKAADTLCKLSLSIPDSYMPKVPAAVELAIKVLRAVAKRERCVAIVGVNTLAVGDSIANTVSDYEKDYKSVPGVSILSAKAVRME